MNLWRVIMNILDRPYFMENKEWYYWDEKEWKYK